MAARDRTSRVLARSRSIALISGACLLGACVATDEEEALAATTAPDVAAQETPPTEESPSAAQEGLRELLARMGVHCFFEERKLEVNGWVNMQAGLIEVFACTPRGKVHEAVVVLDCVPSGLHAGLLALGLEPGTPAAAGADGSLRPPTGDRVEIRARTIGERGEPTVVRAEDWIWNRRDERPLQPCSWIFAGSHERAPFGDPGRVVYAADAVKSLVTTYHDATSILEIPDSSGMDDTLYYANDRALPPTGTPVTLIFSPAEER